MLTPTKEILLNIVIFLWGIGCLIGLISIIMLFLQWKKEDVTSRELWMTGIFVYRDLSKFIKW